MHRGARLAVLFALPPQMVDWRDGGVERDKLSGWIFGFSAGGRGNDDRRARGAAACCSRTRHELQFPCLVAASEGKRKRGEETAANETNRLRGKDQ